MESTETGMTLNVVLNWDKGPEQIDLQHEIHKEKDHNLVKVNHRRSFLAVSLKMGEKSKLFLKENTGARS